MITTRNWLVDNQRQKLNSDKSLTISKVQFSAVQHCLNNTEEYIKDDVKEISNKLDHRNKNNIAVNIKEDGYSV